MSSTTMPPADPRWPEGAPAHEGTTPQTAFPVPFTLVDGALLVIWTIVAQLLIGIPFIALFDIDLDVPAIALLLTATVQVGTLAGIIAWLATRGAATWRVLGPVRPGLRHVGQGIGYGVLGFLLTIGITEGLNRTLGPFTEPEQSLLGLDYDNAGTVTLLVVVACVLAPIVEETVFRSVLLQSARRALGLLPAMGLSAVAFTLVHLEVLNSLPAVVGLLTLALWLAYVMHRSGSLITSIVAHGTYNLIVLTLTIFVVTDATTPV